MTKNIRSKTPEPEVSIFGDRRPFQEFHEILTGYLAPKNKLSSKRRMEIYVQLAFCEAVLANFPKAQSLVDECEEYILSNGKKEERAILYNVKCRLNLENVKHEAALADAIKSLYLFRQLDFHYFTANTSICCGVVCAKLNLFSEAIDHMTRAHTINLQMGDKKGAILVTANLNDIRHSILSKEECIDHNKELLVDIANQYGGKVCTPEVSTYLELSELYVELERLEEAADYAERARSRIGLLAHVPPHHFLYINLYFTLAEIASLRGDEEGVLRYTKECIDRHSLIREGKPEINVLLLLFRFYLRKNDIPKAKAYLDETAEVVTTGNLVFLLSPLHEHFCMYYHALGDSKNELHHFRLVHEYKMKAQQQALNSRAKYMSTVYELEMLQRESDMQRKELEYKTQELNITSHYLQQRNELLSDLQEDIQALRKQKLSPEGIIKNISEKIKQAYAKEDSEKLRFKEKFDEAQREFIAELHQLHPSLSATECRICALLRSGFNTKEIAHLLSSSARTIENHRATIRRKMNLDRTANLNLLLSQIK